MQSESHERSRARSAIQWLADVLWRRKVVSRGGYVALATGTSLGMSGVAALLYYLVAVSLLGLDVPTDWPERTLPLVVGILGMIACAPLAETLVLAMLVGIARGLTDREGLHVLTGALPLGLAHGVLSVTLADAGGHMLVSTVTFLVLALVYVAWRRESFQSAFWMCAAVHAAHNGVMAVVIVAGEAPWMSLPGLGPS